VGTPLRRHLATSSSSGSSPAPAPSDARGAEADLDESELVNSASHSIDRALIERALQSDDQVSAAREWLHEAYSGQLDPDFDRYLEWEAEQVAKLRALRAPGIDDGEGAGALDADEGDGADGEAAAAMAGELEEASEESDEVEGEGEADSAAAGGQAGGRLLPEIPTEFVKDFPGEMLRAEVLSPEERKLLETTAAVHAAEGMPFELAEISHR
jgi:hypothetical protein